MVAMAGVVGDVVKLTLEMHINTVQMRNIYFYQLEDVPTTGYLEGLVAEFVSVVLPSYRATQYPSYVFDTINALNIFSGDEYVHSLGTSIVGTRSPTTDGNATLLAAMIRLTRVNNRVRHGRKAIYIASEGDLSGDVLASAFLTLMNTHAATLDNVLGAGAFIDFFQPIILGRVPVETAGGISYRLPTSQEEMGDNFSIVGLPAVVNRVSTQNSRKFWVGI